MNTRLQICNVTMTTVLLKVGPDTTRHVRIAPLHTETVISSTSHQFNLANLGIIDALIRSHVAFKLYKRPQHNRPLGKMSRFSFDCK